MECSSVQEPRPPQTPHLSRAFFFSSISLASVEKEEELREEPKPAHSFIFIWYECKENTPNTSGPNKNLLSCLDQIFLLLNPIRFHRCENTKRIPLKLSCTAVFPVVKEMRRCRRRGRTLKHVPEVRERTHGRQRCRYSTVTPEPRRCDARLHVHTFIHTVGFLSLWGSVD